MHTIKRLTRVIGKNLWLLWLGFFLYLLATQVFLQFLQNLFPLDSSPKANPLYTQILHHPVLNLMWIIASSLVLYLSASWLLRLRELKVFTLFLQRFSKKR